jgi:hypothetical protein
MIRADLLFYTKEAAGHPVEEVAEVVCMVDVTAGATGLAMGHEGGGGFEVLEAFRTLHACYAVVSKNMLVEICFDIEGLSVVALVIMKQHNWKEGTYSQTNGQ